MPVRPEEGPQVPTIDLELIPGCDHGCAHCYNVWTGKADGERGYVPSGKATTEQLLQMMSELIGQTGARDVIVTGGEPLLRIDAVPVIEALCRMARVQVITNGSHVTHDVARRFGAAGVNAVQLTLLSADQEKHDRLKGAECFRDTLAAAGRLIDAGVQVQACFVAMRENAEDLEKVMELCLVLGIEALSYNRMSATGRGAQNVERLLPRIEQVRANLDTAERLGSEWRIRVATAMPIPPCLVDLSAYRWVHFGWCGTGTDSPNLTVDALGNVRSCNLSSTVLGNVMEDGWSKIAKHPYPHRFRSTLPTMCQQCEHAPRCQGGCKESALAVYGDLAHREPLLVEATDFTQ